MNMPCMRNPLTFTENKSRQLDELTARMENAIGDRLNARESDLREIASRLTALNPLAVLARGYSVPYKDGAPLGSARGLREGDSITVQFADGSADCRVEKITWEEIR